MNNTEIKTGWFQIFIITALTAGAIYYIGQALAEPFEGWSTFNEVRAAELHSVLEG